MCYTLGRQGQVNRQAGKGRTMDRSRIMQAVAKCLAYKACGKEADAKIWFARLCELLGYGEYLKG